MDIFFQDPGEIPLPPEEVRIRELLAEPWTDGVRVKVCVDIDPFQVRPSVDLYINRCGDSSTLAVVSIIESMTRKIEVNIHLPGKPQPGEFLLTAVVYYSPTFHENEAVTAPSQELQPLEVDRKTIQFQMNEKPPQA